jgi:hypothetical protein
MQPELKRIRTGRAQSHVEKSLTVDNTGALPRPDTGHKWPELERNATLQLWRWPGPAARA